MRETKLWGVQYYSAGCSISHDKTIAPKVGEPGNNLVVTRQSLGVVYTLQATVMHIVLCEYSPE